MCYYRTGSLQQLQQTIAAAKELKEADLGIRVSAQLQEVYMLMCFYWTLHSDFNNDVTNLSLSTQDHLIPPGEQAIEEAKQLFAEMQRVHSAFTKIELLLQAVRITYNNVRTVAICVYKLTGTCPNWSHF